MCKVIIIALKVLISTVVNIECHLWLSTGSFADVGKPRLEQLSWQLAMGEGSRQA